MRRLLSPYNDHPTEYWGIQRKTPLGRGLDRAHIPLTDLSVFSPDDFKYLEQYFVFAFVRNPYDRFYSAFQEHVQQRKLPEDTEFNDYVQKNIDPDRIRSNWRFIHFCPQICFTHIGSKSQIDFIGRLETLDEDMRRLGRILELGKFKMRLRPSKSGGDALEHYSNKTIRLVNSLYRNDFDFFGYPIVKPAQRLAAKHKLPIT